MIERFRVGTGWKMNHTLAMARDYAAVLASSQRPDGIELFVLPPALALTEVVRVLAGSGVVVGAQNAHWAEQGAWTGEISMAMVADAGGTLIELGHSERRTHFGETDLDVNKKVRAAIAHGLTPLVCVGETADEKRLGVAALSNARQARMAMAGLNADEARRVCLAYEPVWAIGEGGTPATPEDAQPIHVAIKHAIVDLVGVEPPVLYGGSVNPGNAGSWPRWRRWTGCSSGARRGRPRGCSGSHNWRQRLGIGRGREVGVREVVALEEQRFGKFARECVGEQIATVQTGGMHPFAIVARCGSGSPRLLDSDRLEDDAEQGKQIVHAPAQQWALLAIDDETEFQIGSRRHPADIGFIQGLVERFGLGFVL